MFKKLQHNPSLIGKYVFRQIQWESKVKKILLTFDDGPTPGVTELILERLDKHGIKAVFFCIAEHAEKYPGLISLIQKNGHLIGSHSLNHQNMINMNRADIGEDITRSITLLSGIAQAPITYFRSPYGRFNVSVLSVCKEQKLSLILWSLLMHDYKNDLKLVKFALQYLSNKSIVVLHDNVQSQSVVSESIDMLVEKARIMNFEFGNPLECLK